MQEPSAKAFSWHSNMSTPCMFPPKHTVVIASPYNPIRNMVGSRVGSQNNIWTGLFAWVFCRLRLFHTKWWVQMWFTNIVSLFFIVFFVSLSLHVSLSLSVLSAVSLHQHSYVSICVFTDTQLNKSYFRLGCRERCWEVGIPNPLSTRNPRDLQLQDFKNVKQEANLRRSLWGMPLAPKLQN